MAILLAVGYPDQDTAARAASALLRHADRLVIQPDAVAVIERNAWGDYRVLTTHHPVAEGPSWSLLWSLLFAQLFFVPVFGTTVGPALGSVFGKIEKNGINRAFQQQVRDMVTPGSSALFLLASHAGAESVLAALARFEGTALSSPLTPRQEAGLQEALYGQLRATASS